MINGLQIIVKLMFVIVPILVLSGFIYTIVLTFSPKARSKMLKKNIETMKYVYDENKEVLHDISTTSANISKDAIKIKSRAIKEGFINDDCVIYCKYCGGEIDSDSTYCKHCGKKL